MRLRPIDIELSKTWGHLSHACTHTHTSSTPAVFKALSKGNLAYSLIY